MDTLPVAPHPHLHLRAFMTQLPAPVGDLPSPGWLQASLLPNAPAPVRPGEEMRGAVRALLRYGGFRPAGRSKPAAEYLARAAGEGALRSINVVVDLCNVVSLHSGIPISVIDLDRAVPPLRVEIAPAGTSYVFNATGQLIDVAGLLCLLDGEGPCANAVKDAQRTKTSETTTRCLSVLWGPTAGAAVVDAALAWYLELTRHTGATTSMVTAQLQA